MFCAMRLREWRQTQEMTIAQAAELFGIKHARTFQRYETGEILPDAPFVEKSNRISGGAVTAEDFYHQRAEWLSANTAEAAE